VVVLFPVLLLGAVLTYLLQGDAGSMLLGENA